MSDDDSPRWALPMLQAGQAQKELSHNEALVRLDAIVQASVSAVGLDTPPADPAPGQSWITGDAPSGAWSGQARALASWTTGGWRFVAPREGMAVWNGAQACVVRYRDAAWRSGELRGAQVVIDGTVVLRQRQPAIAAPTGGATVDIEARQALSAILAMLRSHGLIDT